MDGYKDLGYMNGWKETPPEYDRCKKLGHPLKEDGIGRCLAEYSCPICKIKFKVDSSD